MKQHFEARTKVGSLEVILLFIIVFFSFFLFPQNSFAQDAGRSSSIPSFGGATILIWVICYSRRKRPIGGWLLYYFIALYGGFLISIMFLGSSLSSYVPGGWDNKLHYLLFIIATIPGYILAIAQIVLSYYLISQALRNWKYIELLRKLLLISFIYFIGKILIYVTLWAQTPFFSVLAASYSLLWFLYFKQSVRVECVFKDKQWSWETFLKKKKLRREQLV